MRRSIAMLFAGVLLAATPAAKADVLVFPTWRHDYRHFRVTLTDIGPKDALRLTDYETAPAPVGRGVWLVVNQDFALFRDGRPLRVAGLERLVEDGDPSELLVALGASSFVHAFGLFEPNLPFEFFARPGEKLVFVVAFPQSNDVFLAPARSGIPLFDFDRNPIAGDVTGRVRLWDAGTEVNERPGLGGSQALRQPRPDYGTIERGSIRQVRDGYDYPPVGAILDLRIAVDPRPYVPPDSDQPLYGSFVPQVGQPPVEPPAAPEPAPSAVLYTPPAPGATP
jgi:hypothetical protein